MLQFIKNIIYFFIEKDILVSISKYRTISFLKKRIIQLKFLHNVVHVVKYLGL